MEYRIAPARRGLAWFQGGVRMLDRNPRGLIGVSLCLVLLEQLPGLLVAVPALSMVLSVTMLVLGPALLAGLQFAIAEALAGRPVALGYLFEGLRRPQARTQLIVLGLLTLSVVLLMGLVMQRILGPDSMKLLTALANQQIKPDSTEFQAIFPPLLKATAAALAIGFVLMVGLFFAVPRVMFDGRGAMTALGESYIACAANVVPLLLYGLMFGAALFVACIGMGIAAIFFGLLGQVGVLLVDLVALGIGVVGMLVNASGNYLAWREVFGRGAVPGERSGSQAGIIV